MYLEPHHPVSAGQGIGQFGRPFVVVGVFSIIVESQAPLYDGTLGLGAPKSLHDRQGSYLPTADWRNSKWEEQGKV